MFNRVIFFLIAAFWVVMNLLLWRAEYGREKTVGSAVPVAMVWRKMLSAPDNSSLLILRRGRSVGFCRWATEIIRSPAVTAGGDEALPEDMVRRLADYRVELDGSALVTEFTNHLRFDFSTTLTPGQAWRDLSLRLGYRHNAFVVRSVAAEQTVRLTVSSADDNYERSFAFAGLQNPRALLDEFDLPLPLLSLAGSYLPPPAATNAPPSLGVTWTANEDWLMLGHTPTRVYRLQTRLLDRFALVIIVSRAGEILRAELPGEWVLVNDRLSGM